jgi:hypothetical protein
MNVDVKKNYKINAGVIPKWGNNHYFSARICEYKTKCILFIFIDLI